MSLEEYFIKVDESAVLAGDRKTVQSMIDYELGDDDERYGPTWKNELPKGAPLWAAWTGKVGGAESDLFSDCEYWPNLIVAAAALSSAYSESMLTYSLPGNPGGFDGKKLNAYGIIQPLVSTVAHHSGVKEAKGWGCRIGGQLYWLSKEGSRRLFQFYNAPVITYAEPLVYEFVNRDSELGLQERLDTCDNFVAFATRMNGWGIRSTDHLKKSKTFEEYVAKIAADSAFNFRVQSVYEWSVNGRWEAYYDEFKPQEGGVRYSRETKVTPKVADPKLLAPKGASKKDDVPPTKRRTE